MIYEVVQFIVIDKIMFGKRVDEVVTSSYRLNHRKFRCFRTKRALQKRSVASGCSEILEGL